MTTYHQMHSIASNKRSGFAIHLCGTLAVLLIGVMALSTAHAEPVVATRKATFRGEPRVITVENGSAPNSVKVFVKDASNNVIATLKLEARKGLEASVMTACDAVNLVGKKQTVVGCLSTIGAGVCLYTGAGGGVGAGYCIATIEHAVNGGAIDCVKGLAGEIANAIGEKESFDVFQDATITPSDITMRSLEKACEAAKKKLNLP